MWKVAADGLSNLVERRESIAVRTHERQHGTSARSIDCGNNIGENKPTCSDRPLSYRQHGGASA
jgi:hypothetical protein